MSFSSDAPTKAAAHVTAALHEIKIVSICGAFGKTPKDAVGRIVYQEHNVRHLERRAAAHAYAGRNALRHRALGGTYR